MGVIKFLEANRISKETNIAWSLCGLWGLYLAIFRGIYFILPMYVVAYVAVCLIIKRLNRKMKEHRQKNNKP